MTLRRPSSRGIVWLEATRRGSSAASSSLLFSRLRNLFSVQAIDSVLKNIDSTQSDLD